MIKPGELAVIRSHMLSVVEVTYKLGHWLPVTILIDICDARHIKPPDILRVEEVSPGNLRLAIARDTYVCSVIVRNDTDTIDAPFFRSACHALLDAYESRAREETPPIHGVLHAYRT